MRKRALISSILAIAALTVIACGYLPPGLASFPYPYAHQDPTRQWHTWSNRHPSYAHPVASYSRCRCSADAHHTPSDRYPDAGCTDG